MIPVHGMRSGLVYHAGALGDLIVAIPAIERWAAARRVERLTLLGRGHPGELLRAAGIVDDLWDAGAAWFARAYRGAPPALPAPVGEAPIREAPIREALAFTEPGGPVERALAKAIAGPVSAVRPAPADRQPIVIHHLRAVGAGPAAARAPALSLPGSLRPGTLQLAPGCGGRRVAIAPGSGSARKNWPLDRFAAAADALRQDAAVTWVLGPAEADLRPPAARGDRIVRDRPIVRTAQAIAACALLLGNDSGLAHLAAALSVAVVALFAVSDAAVWAPAAAAPVLVVTPRSTLPGDRCAALPPPQEGASMESIAVDPVISACRRLLA